MASARSASPCPAARRSPVSRPLRSAPRRPPWSSDSADNAPRMPHPWTEHKGPPAGRRIRERVIRARPVRYPPGFGGSALVIMTWLSSGVQRWPPSGWPQSRMAVLGGGGVFGPVFEQDKPRVQDLGVHQFEPGPLIAGADRLPASVSQDEGEDHEPEPVDQPVPDQAPHQRDTADRTERFGGPLLERPHLVAEFAAEEAGVSPSKRLGESVREDHLWHLVHSGADLIAGRRRDLRHGLIGDAAHDQDVRPVEDVTYPVLKVRACVAEEGALINSRGEPVERDEQVRD